MDATLLAVSLKRGAASNGAARYSLGEERGSRASKSINPPRNGKMSLPCRRAHDPKVERERVRRRSDETAAAAPAAVAAEARRAGRAQKTRLEARLEEDAAGVFRDEEQAG